MVTDYLTSTITAEAHMESDNLEQGKREIMNADIYDEEYLRSIEEGLEKILEKILKEDE